VAMRVWWNVRSTENTALVAALSSPNVNSVIQFVFEKPRGNTWLFYLERISKTPKVSSHGLVIAIRETTNEVDHPSALIGSYIPLPGDWRGRIPGPGSRLRRFFKKMDSLR